MLTKPYHNKRFYYKTASSVQKIDEIKRMRYSAGRHDILFRRYDLEPGIYFYRIKASSFVEVKKMVITKN